MKRLIPGGKAVNMDGSAPPDVAPAEGIRAGIITDGYGRQLIDTSHPNAWSVTETNSNAQTNNELKAAPGTDLSLYITDIVISNGGTAGSVLFVESTTSSPVTVIEKLYFGVNSGAPIRFITPIKLTANKNFGFTSDSVSTHTILVNGYTAP